MENIENHNPEENFQGAKGILKEGTEICDNGTWKTLATRAYVEVVAVEDEQLNLNVFFQGDNKPYSYQVKKEDFIKSFEKE